MCFTRTPRVLVVILLMTLSSNISHAQSDLKYKRSALHLVLIDQGDYFGNKYLRSTFFESAFPDKYDRHPVSDSLLLISDYMTYQERIQSDRERRERAPQAVRSNAANLNKGVAEVMGEDDEMIKAFVEEYIDSRDIARQMVAEWFLRDENGTFSMEEVMSRGAYNASILDAATADESTMGYNLIRDAGSELIANTFVIFTNLNLVDNAPFVSALESSSARKLNTMKTGKWTSLKNKVQLEGSKKLKNGHIVWTTGYLYKLKWDEEIESRFFQDFWISRGQVDAERKKSFEETGLFQLEFVGYTYAQSMVSEKLLREEDEESLVTRVTMRNVEACYASLQKEYDVFKPKVPLLTTGPPSASIGKKEGLSGKERFEVLELSEDTTTGIQSLNRVDVITVDPDRIWDNRYGADELFDAGGESGRTYFKGGSGNLYPGMLIRQIK